SSAPWAPRATIATEHFSTASARAVAPPMPREAPTSSAALPASLRSMRASLSRDAGGVRRPRFGLEVRGLHRGERVQRTEARDLWPERSDDDHHQDGADAAADHRNDGPEQRRG